MKVELLLRTHKRQGFSCEVDSLTDYIRNQVSQDVKRKLAACFVISGQESEVVGYYTLSTESLHRNEVPEKYRKKLPLTYRAPVILLGRLARDIRQKGKGIGEFLLIDALLRCYTLSNESVGAIAVVVDPIDEYARNFYGKFGFIELPDSGRMFIPMNTIARLVEKMK